MGDAQAGANLTDPLAFRPTFGAQTMVDGRGFNLARSACRCQQQKREAVRSTRDGNANALAAGDQPAKIGSESLNEGGIGNHPEPPSTSAALSLGLACSDLFLEVGADLCAIDGFEFRIGFAGLPGLAQFDERLTEIIKTVRRAFALRIAAIIGEQGLGCAPGIALVELRPTDKARSVAIA
jgi:hypothetical protein